MEKRIINSKKSKKEDDGLLPFLFVIAVFASSFFFWGDAQPFNPSLDICSEGDSLILNQTIMEVKTMIEKVAKVGIKKEPNYLYFIDREGDICRTPATRGKKKHIQCSVMEERIVKVETCDNCKFDSVCELFHKNKRCSHYTINYI